MFLEGLSRSKHMLALFWNMVVLLWDAFACKLVWTGSLSHGKCEELKKMVSTSKASPKYKAGYDTIAQNHQRAARPSAFLPKRRLVSRLSPALPF